MTAVGGTTLILNGSNIVTSETVWNDTLPGPHGGGTSIYFNRPPWQSGTGVKTSAMRQVPDIACSADPDYGAVTYLDGQLGIVGGTSWASPTCAAFSALMNQARANAGLTSNGLLGPSIYPLIGTSSFRDITSGNNATPSSGGKYSATVGFDECSGIGTPLLQALTTAGYRITDFPCRSGARAGRKYDLHGCGHRGLGFSVAAPADRQFVLEQLDGRRRL